MSRLVIAATGLALLGVAASANAKDDLEPRTRAMLACRSIAPDDARLRCYDQSMAALKEAIDQGSVVLDDRPKMGEGIVKASGQSGENRYWVELESGERWTLLPTTARRGPPQPGSNVKVRRPFVGSGYWISGPDWEESRAEYVGRGS